MNKKIIFFIVLSCILICAPQFAARAAGKSDDNNYVLGFDFDNSSGAGSSQIFEFVDNALKTMNKEYGVNIQLRKFANDNASMMGLLNNEIDAAGIGIDSIIDIMKRSDKIRPWTTITVGGNRKVAYCVWTRKKDNILKPEDLYGKKAPLYAANTTLRWYLYEHGIDKPLYDVFDSFTPIPSVSSAFMALDMGDIDIMWASSDSETQMKFMNAGLMKKLRKSFCTDSVFARGGIVVNMDRLSEAKLKRATTMINDFNKNFEDIAKRHPEMKTAAAYRKMIKITMITVDKDEYEFDKIFRTKIIKDAWMKEDLYVTKAMDGARTGAPVKVRPTYQMCKESCGKKSASKTLACIEACISR